MTATVVVWVLLGLVFVVTRWAQERRCPPPGFWVVFIGLAPLMLLQAIYEWWTA